MRVQKFVQWQAGPGTPVKYSFEIDANLDVVSVTDNVATLKLEGKMILTNYPTNSRNSFAASDFAVLLPGDKDMGSADFTPGTYYYQAALPCLPNTSADFANSLIAEFRGDTWRSDPNNSNNKVSLYISDYGMLINQFDREGVQEVTFSRIYTCTVHSGESPILIWYSSGANDATSYNWLEKKVWATWADLDYRPGATWDGSTWQSHNRSNGACHMFNGSSYIEMRTANGGVGTDNPPFMWHGDAWKNQRKIGANG